MNEQEALKLGKALYDNITSNSNNIIPTKDYIKYVAKANEALEKQVAKKPVFKFKYENGTKFYDCPICGSYVMHAGVQSKEQYCSHCGQKLDWSDEE